MELDNRTIARYLTELTGHPVEILTVVELGGEATGAAALKAFGYGRPLSIEFRADAAPGRVVLRRVNRNGYGRERTADRVAAVWQDFESFNVLPRHVRAIDMAGLTQDGQMQSLGQTVDILLLTDYAPGQPYADDLLRIRDSGLCTDLDLRRAKALAGYLAGIHRSSHDDPLLWRRRLRDLVDHGEGVMGLAESYPPDDPVATPSRLQAIEQAVNRWRWQLKPLAHRLSQVHGDFHPFNVLFTEGIEFNLLDRSRGEWGEPADDVSCMAVNYLFFSLQRNGWLDDPFGALYNAFWETYLALRPDDEMAAVIQPWFAWRALVLASPRWYPTMTAEVREKLLTFAQRVLAEQRFEWRTINRYLEVL